MNDLQISTQAIQQSMLKFQAAAERTARGPADPAFVANAVELKLAQRELEAAVKVFKAQDEVAGYMLDVLA